MDKEPTLFAEFRQGLTRAAWRMQYRNRFRVNREIPIAAAERVRTGELNDRALSALFVQEMLQAIPSYPGRTVMNKLIVEGKTEREVSRELGITQQAVNKWKKKSVAALRLRMENSSY